VVIGLGIVAMHFTGMAGLEVAGRIEWDWTLVGVSVLFALCFGTATTHILARHRFRFSRPLAMVLLVIAICTMHFTAMGAATLVPDPSVRLETTTLSSEFLAVLVLATMAIITGLALYTIDARSQRELLDGFRHAALHDVLTGLPNRAFLSANLPDLLENDRASGMQTAVLVIDLDRFKEINDVHGHHTGDFLLQDLARRLTQ
jgi:predicted signal transduction protein with EAL and GGDEF domain